ncbi:amino acid ABC transporter substrate-binding protein, PAAT family [Lishizhenia tianjinensis]|uniref:Amino acid ABC transporter substrate-binding protein, PAAT family n=1 Tax=Lishizhenia tianjinensis TaxID=477690 RepID=A0A1I6XUD5_9FLAO|nr:transporter substrate-binding domain-containing protein [Lishizhenia tianjinensis]SFT41394.1 amino acid ABC transporter substrate-binding protein, PAAT family [Lishizhenia tianjinensis]
MTKQFVYIVILVFSLSALSKISFAQTDSSYHQSDSSLNIAYHITPPFVSVENNNIQGPGAWLWKQVNLEIDLYQQPQILSFEQVLSNLENGEVDICISPLSITSQRMEKFDFSVPFYTTKTTLLTRSIPTWKRSWRFFKSFFSLNFFKALGALSFVILIFGFAVWLFERKHNNEEFGEGIKGLWNGFWWSAVTMTTVGYGDKSPKTLGGRVIALFWMFTAIIIISGFTAGITSSLTTNEMSTNIASTQDLKNKNVATVKNSGTAKWFEDNFFNQVHYYTTLEEALEALENEEIDYIAYDQPILQHVINTDEANSFELIDFSFNAQFYAMAFRKEIPAELKKKISLQITKATESLEWKLLLNEYNLIKE